MPATSHCKDLAVHHESEKKSLLDQNALPDYVVEGMITLPNQVRETQPGVKRSTDAFAAHKNDKLSGFLKDYSLAQNESAQSTNRTIAFQSGEKGNYQPGIESIEDGLIPSVTHPAIHSRAVGKAIGPLELPNHLNYSANVDFAYDIAQQEPTLIATSLPMNSACPTGLPSLDDGELASFLVESSKVDLLGYLFESENNSHSTEESSPQSSSRAPLATVPSRAITTQTEIDAKQQLDAGRNQLSDRVGFSSDIFCSNDFAPEFQNHAESLAEESASSQRVFSLDRTNSEEQSLGPATSQTSTDAFATSQESGSCGYSFESEEISPILQGDSPSSPSQRLIPSEQNQTNITGQDTNQEQSLQQKQTAESFRHSSDSYFSSLVADQNQGIATSEYPKLSFQQGLTNLEGMDIGEQSLGTAQSQTSTEAFASLHQGDSFGYCCEAEMASFTKDDSPRPPSNGWTAHLSIHDKVGDVILVPRPGRLDWPVSYTGPSQHPNPYNNYSALALSHAGPGLGGRRKIQLKLQEDVKRQDVTRGSFFFRKKSARGYGRESIAIGPVEELVDRGTITVSWYDGTTSEELDEHVRRSVSRKLGPNGGTKVYDIRILDESFDPPEEVVLSPCIPDGSRFLLRFCSKEKHELDFQRYQNGCWSERAPETPGASPSPYPSSHDLAGLNATQLALLASRWNPLSTTTSVGNGATSGSPPVGILKNGLAGGARTKRFSEATAEMKALHNPEYEEGKMKATTEGESCSKVALPDTDDCNPSLEPNDPIGERLRKITELLLVDRNRHRSRIRQEKRQVIFMMANFFVLFLSLIAISAEIQARAPSWLSWVERELASVQQCATDQDALFSCVSNGDFAGVVASVVLWLSRSATTKRIFLFGFKSPKQLWTVVYEALVTGVCFGFSNLFIQRAMNPETRKNYFQKYWKDAVYGSLAGFNAAFMKHVLKNLIPQERFEEALHQKQLNIFSWFSSVIKK